MNGAEQPTFSWIACRVAVFNNPVEDETTDTAREANVRAPSTEGCMTMWRSRSSLTPDPSPNTLSGGILYNLPPVRIDLAGRFLHTK